MRVTRTASVHREWLITAAVEQGRRALRCCSPPRFFSRPVIRAACATSSLHTRVGGGVRTTSERTGARRMRRGASLVFGCVVSAPSAEARAFVRCGRRPPRPRTRTTDPPRRPTATFAEALEERKRADSRGPRRSSPSTGRRATGRRAQCAPNGSGWGVVCVWFRVVLLPRQSYKPTRLGVGSIAVLFDSLDTAWSTRTARFGLEPRLPP